MNNNQEILDSSEMNKTKRKDRFGIDYRNVIEDISPSGEMFNKRDDYGTEEELLALAHDIAINGQIDDCIGFRKGEQFVLTDGYRRRLAITLYNQKALQDGAKEVPIPIIWCQVGSTNAEERIFTMLRTGNNPFKKQLNRVEEASGIAKLVSLGWDKAEIAVKLGRSSAYVYDSLRLDNAPKVLKNMVVSKEIAATEAVKIIKDCKDDHPEIRKTVELLKGMAAQQQDAPTPQPEVEKLDSETPKTETPKKVKVTRTEVEALKAKTISDTLTDKLKIAISEAKKVGLNTTVIESFLELLSLNPKAIDQTILNDLVGNIATKFTE